MADPDSVTRWTSQILEQIDSLPNLQQVGVDAQPARPQAAVRPLTINYANISKSYVCFFVFSFS